MVPSPSRSAAGVPHALSRSARSAPPTTLPWEEEWERALLDQCLDRVRREVEPGTHAAFEAVVRLGLSAGDAARDLGVPVTVVYNAKHRVLTRIRELREQFER